MTNNDKMSAKTKATRSFTERIPIPQHVQTDWKVVTVDKQLHKIRR